MLSGVLGAFGGVATFALLRDAGQLDLVISLGFLILLGSVVHENVPWMLATIHAGDWLVKLVLMAAILGAWRGGPREAKGVR